MRKKVCLSWLTCLCLFSCSTTVDEVSEQPLPESKTHEITLGFAGDLQIEETPLPKSGTPQVDVYGIQVFSRPDDAYGYQEYRPYASGVFEGKNGMKISLMTGYKYKFIATMVKDGKNRINNSYHVDQQGNVSSHYSAPFDQIADNKFVISTSTNKEWSFGSGSAYYRDTINGNPTVQSHSRPKTDRYYGDFQDYLPVEGGAVSIPMHRTVFGVRFVAGNLVEGKLNIEMENAPVMYIETGEGKPQQVENILTFSSVSAARDYVYPGMGSNGSDTTSIYTENVLTTITWEKADGSLVPIAHRSIPFKRNKMHTITINVSEDSTEGTMDFEIDNTPMGDGDNTIIGGTPGTETPVDPTP